MAMMVTYIGQGQRSAAHRIEKEMSEDLSPERQCGVWLAMPEATGNPLRATILGPEGTPYEGGRFKF